MFYVTREISAKVMWQLAKDPIQFVCGVIDEMETNNPVLLDIITNMHEQIPENSTRLLMDLFACTVYFALKQAAPGQKLPIVYDDLRLSMWEDITTDENYSLHKVTQKIYAENVEIMVLAALAEKLISEWTSIGLNSSQLTQALSTGFLIYCLLEKQLGINEMDEIFRET